MVLNFGLKGQRRQHKYTREWTARVAPHYALLVPEDGARLYTIVGEARTIAKVFLSPGCGLTRHERRHAEAHPLVMCCVRGDPGYPLLQPPQPLEFHATTLRWALFNSERIAIWSAAFPEQSDEYARWAVEATNAGARFMTTIETTPARAAEWSLIACRWKREKVPVQFFGPDRDWVAAERIDMYRHALCQLD